MLALFFSGVLVAVGHHLLYSRLDGTIVRGFGDGSSQYLTQTWILRYGTALAFLTKTLLASAVVVAYKQHMWINLRRKPNSVSTINAIFAATYDFLALTSPRLFLKARLPALMAFIIWCLPLATLLTPSTLLVVPSTRPNTTAIAVPSLNLWDASLYAFAGLGDGSSPLLNRLTVGTASRMDILPMPAVAPNTTYQHIFKAPSLKCEKATGGRLDNITAIWNATEKAIQGSAGAYVKYVALDVAESYLNTYNATEVVEACIMGTRDRYCSSNLDGSTDGPAIWGRLDGEDAITCAIYNTTFTLNLTSSGDVQSISSMTFEWAEKSAEISPQNRIAKYLSRNLATLLSGAIGAVMSGPVGHSGDSGMASLVTQKTRIMDTALIGLVSTAFRGTWGGPLAELPEADRALAGNRTLGEMIEELSRNQTLSLFSSERFWESKENSIIANVTQIQPITIYEYQPRNLIMTYAIAIAVSAACVILGLRALWLNGVSHDNSFSSIVATTRSSLLDHITLGHSLGATPVPRPIAETKLRFGELQRDGVSRVGFGMDDETMPLRKGQMVF
ncbi:hypothetical protein M011DRAFT_487283 [Sporormia fimetaria CBS 119925]|uniref:Uncharacterized protein n=1 Tax=Sporormia fimetaria CBS 119925 TaxID=1340428 RepID=A0A6A6VBN2_9PLEO|nr:hypothetical protein M011DRAFT_487283 [Sporormia fimetaria CBS 119925]